MTGQQDALSAAGPAAHDLYKKLLGALKPLGAFEVEVKKTSIHFVHKSAFAGVHPRKQHLGLTIKAARAIHSARIHKAEQVSKSRWHLETKVTAPEEIDAELLKWLGDAYELCG